MSLVYDLDERIYGNLNTVSMKTCKSYFHFVFYPDIVLVLLESTIEYNHPGPSLLSTNFVMSQVKFDDYILFRTVFKTQ